MRQLLDTLDQLDELCRQEHMLTLAASSAEQQLIRWWFTEFVRQGAGHKPTSWPDYIRTQGHAPDATLDRSIALADRGPVPPLMRGCLDEQVRRQGAPAPAPPRQPHCAAHRPRGPSPTAPGYRAERLCRPRFEPFYVAKRDQHTGCRLARSMTPQGPPTEYRITALALAGEEASVEAGTSRIQVDARWGAAPSGLPGPTELLASAFAACLLKNLARAGDLLGFAYEQAQVEVVARRQDSPPKVVEISHTLRVTTDEPEPRLELAHLNLRNHGTVYNTLAAVCDVHGQMLAVRPADTPTPTSTRGD